MFVKESIHDIKYSLGNLVEYLTYYVCIFAIIFVYLIVLLVDTNISYLCGVECKWDNVVLLLIIVPFIFLLAVFICLWDSEKVINRKFILILLGSSALLLILQIYISFNIYFYTGWDCEALMNTAIIVVETGKPNPGHSLSMYPNNKMLTALMVILMKIVAALGMDEFYFSGIIAANIAVNLAGFFMVITIKKLLNSRMLPWIAYGIYIILVALSPWITIPYSDAYGIIFPITIYFIYIYPMKKEIIKWAIIGFLSFIGLQIKPTVIVILIAIIAVEIIKLLKETIKLKVFIINRIAILGIVFAITQVLSAGIISILNVEIDEKEQIPMTHFLMMGLNTSRDGIYSQDDVDFTRSFDTLEKKKEANLKMVKERVHEMGIRGLIELIVTKTLVNYNDGTFAWGAEGNFYAGIVPTESKMALELREVYYHDGKYYETIFVVLTKIIWLLVLTLMLGLAVKSPKNINEQMLVAVLTIFGLTLFLWIFEARARYLYLFLPMYIICAFMGLQALNEKIYSIYNAKGKVLGLRKGQPK